VKPAYDVDPRDLDRAFAELLDLLNRTLARSRTVQTWIPPPQTPLVVETTYLPIFTPTEPGTTLLSSKLLPADAYRIARSGDYITIGVGYRSSDRYEVVGREWSSKESALEVALPYDLVTEETPIPSGVTLSVRAVRYGWPNAWPHNASVETTMGYDPGA